MPPATSHSHSWAAPAATDAFWNALIHDSGAAVAVFDADAWAHFANPVFLRMAGVKSLEELKRLSIEDRLQHDMAEERLLILREVLRTGRPQMFKDLRRGRALVITARQFPGQPGFALAIFRPADIPNWASDAEPTDVDSAQIKHTDPGPLSVLSEREKEILALIGQGMTSAQIAKKLCRTIKTIEWHRSAIARKLHTKDRVALAQMAIQAGLCSPTFKVPMGKGRGRGGMAAVKSN
jgi:DNA-binding CsgD family transcriptional regulator